MQDNQIINTTGEPQIQTNNFSKNAFGEDFVWGVAMASFQNKGGWNLDGKSESIWDKFSNKRYKIKDRQNAKIACDFYHRFEEDILIAKSLNFNTFRFSISWSRILPDGIGKANSGGSLKFGANFTYYWTYRTKNHFKTGKTSVTCLLANKIKL